MATTWALHRCSCLAYQRATFAATVISGTPQGITVSIPSGGGGFRALKFFRLAKNYCSSPTSTDTAVVVANDDKYGNKQVISLTPRLYDYMLSNVREPEVFSYCTFLSLWLRFILAFKKKSDSSYFRFCGNCVRRLLLCVAARCR